MDLKGKRIFSICITFLIMMQLVVIELILIFIDLKIYLKF